MKSKIIKHFSYFLLALLVLCSVSRIYAISEYPNADSIHQNILCLDSHIDTPLLMVNSDFDINNRNDPRQRGGKVDFPRMKEAGLDAAFFAVYLSQGKRDAESYEQARKTTLKIFNSIFEGIENSNGMAALATHSSDAQRFKENNQLAIYIGLENAYPIGTDLNKVQKYYDLGARYISLTHNFNNDAADSSTDPNGPEHNGLSDFGKDIIREMNRLGMMIDVSHISDEAYFDILEITKTPVIASHSNVRAIRDISRNFSDEMLFALKENGGVIQVNFVSYFVKDIEQNPDRIEAINSLRATYDNFSDLPLDKQNKVREKWFAINEEFPPKLATVSDLVDHIDYIVNLIGIDHVGIGSDFDGGGALEDCFDVTELPNITKELLKRGYSIEDIEKIWSKNFLRVFKEVEAFAGK